MLAFIPSGALSAYSPTYNPYAPTSGVDNEMFADSYGYGLDERALYAAHLQHQARELALSRRRHALQAEAERQQRAQALVDAESLVWAASLRHRQEVLARRAYMEDQRRQAELARRELLRREVERAEFVRRERERAERARQHAALEELNARKRYLAETLRHARSEPGNVSTTARQQHERPLRRVRFSLDDLLHENLPDYQAAHYASRSAHQQQPAAPEYTPVDSNQDHAREFSFVNEFLSKHPRAAEDPEVRETAQSLLAHLLGSAPAPAPFHPYSASPAAQLVSAPAEQSSTTQRAPVAESIPIPFAEPAAPSVASAAPSPVPQPNTPIFAPAAAEKLLSIYHTYRARRSAFSTLSSINDTLDTLSTSFVLPEHLDFTPSDTDSTSDASSDAGSEASSTLAYTDANRPLRAHEHALAALLTRLDSVESNGDAKVRSERKRLVKKVEKALAEMDALVEEARKKQEAEVTATDASSAPSPDLATEVPAPSMVAAPSMAEVATALGAQDATSNLVPPTADAPPAASIEDLATTASLNEAGSSIPTKHTALHQGISSFQHLALPAEAALVDDNSASEPSLQLEGSRSLPEVEVHSVDEGAALMPSIQEEVLHVADTDNSVDQPIATAVPLDTLVEATIPGVVGRQVDEPSTAQPSPHDGLSSMVTSSSTSTPASSVIPTVVVNDMLEPEDSLDNNFDTSPTSVVDTFLLPASVPPSPSPRAQRVLPADLDGELVMVDDERVEDGWSEVEA